LTDDLLILNRSAIIIRVAQTMPGTNVQFSLASHLMTVLADSPTGYATSKELAESICVNPTFIRKTIAKLGKAGLVLATRGAAGACKLARPPKRITLLDIYLASQGSPVFSVHTYPTNGKCNLGVAIKKRMGDVLNSTQSSFELNLASMTLYDLMPSTEHSANSILYQA
jgi:Rrf2 family protein